MSKLNEKIAELVKGNKAIESYIEVTAMESTSQAKQEKLLEQLKSANDRLIDSWVKSGAFALSVDKELANIMKELKSEKLSITMKKLIPLVVGSYSLFRRNVQIGNLTKKQVEAFRNAVHKDSSIAVQKLSLLDFANGKKRAKPTPKPTPKADSDGGEDKAKDGGEESTPKSNIVGVFELKGKGIKVELIEDENGRSVELNGASLKDVAKAFKLFQTQIEMLTEVRVKK